MGSHDVAGLPSEADRRAFTHRVLADLDAFEAMLASGAFETGKRRLGVEQELFLVDDHGRAAPCAAALLDALDPAVFTTELAQFNLEANLPPREFGPTTLSTLEADLDGALDAVRRAGDSLGVHPLLTGILPSLDDGDLSLDNMSPSPRYRLLNDRLLQERGSGFLVHIRGTDSLEMVAENIMLESANTSFQVHYQVDPARCSALYNLAQLISAPLLAGACNSPLLFGRRLWRETRVALFERSTDERSRGARRRGAPPRVNFGDRWLDGPITDLFRDDLAHYHVLLTPRLEDPDAREVLAGGTLPKLRALALHSGTVWRWNRACFGVTGDTAHLRIENRILPAGPTPADEVANAAFFYGLMAGLDAEADSIPDRLRFDHARANMVAAARVGLAATLRWLDGVDYRADALIPLLLPTAHDGLRSLGVTAAEANHYLGILEARVTSGQTGARWLTDGAEQLPRPGRQSRLVRETLRRQAIGTPVHTWPPVAADPSQTPQVVRDVMSSQLYTLRPDDSLSLALAVMRWRGVHQVPIEALDGRPVGIVTFVDAEARLQRAARLSEAPDALAVSDALRSDVEHVGPDRSLTDVALILDASAVDCVLVVGNGLLIGLVTATDLEDARAESERPR